MQDDEARDWNEHNEARCKRMFCQTPTRIYRAWIGTITFGYYLDYNKAVTENRGAAIETIWLKG